MNSQDLDDRSRRLALLKHDLNNVLTGVKTGLELMAMEEVFESGELKDDLDDIVKASRRLGAMLEDLNLVFCDAAKATHPPSMTSLGSIVEEWKRQASWHPYALNVEAPDAEFKTHTPILVRALFYAGQLLAEAGPVNASVRPTDAGITFVFHLSSEQFDHMTAMRDDAEGRGEMMLNFISNAMERLQGRAILKGDSDKAFYVLQVKP